MKRRRTRQFQRGDRDANEKFFYPVLKAAQQEYRLLPTGFGADILLVMNPIAFIEVKNGEGAQLTEKEKILKWHCEAESIEFYIVRTVEEMTDIINRRKALKESTNVQ